MIKHVTELNELEELVKEGKTLVDFFATWCGPCKMIAPVLEQLDADKDFNVQIIKVDVDEAEEIARKFQIQAIPTLILFENGKSLKSQLGFMRKDQIIDFCK